MASKAKKVEIQKIVIPPMPERVLCVEIEGNLMLHNKITEEAIAAIEKKPGKGTGNKPDHSKKAEKWLDTAHVTEDGEYGFPAEAFLKAMGSVVKGVDLKNKKLFKFGKDLYRALHIESDAINQSGEGIVLYAETEDPVCQKHMAWLQGKTPVPIYRALFKNWKMTLRVVYNASLLDEHDVLLLVNRAGKSVGVGAFRAENRGPFGLFKVTGAYFEDSGGIEKEAA